SPVTTRRTPRSTLFPYTTLFRSLRRRRSRLRQRDLRHAQARAGERRQLPGDAEDGETVRAVRRDLDVEDVIVEAEIGDEVPSERSEEHTSELQSRFDLVCRLLLE